MTDSRAGPRRREGEVRRLARADHRLPGAGRRQLRQHPRHREGRPEDRAPSCCSNSAALDDDAHAPDEIPGKVGENLRAGLATLELSQRAGDHQHRPGAAAVARGAHPADRRTCQLRELYTRLELRALLRQLDGEAAARRRPPLPPLRRHRPRCRPPRRRPRGARGRAPLRDHPAWPDLERWLARLRTADAVRLRHRDHQPRLHEGARSSASPLPGARRGRLRAAAPRLSRRPEQLDRARVLARPASRSWRTRRAARSATTSSTTRTCCSIPASASPACASTPCSSRTCGTASRPATTWTRTRSATSASRPSSIEEVAGKGAKQICFDQVSIERASEYAAEDADVTLRLHQCLWPQLQGVPALARLYEEWSSRWCRC